MRIVYVGNFRPDSSTETHVAYTLEDLGHEVLRLQENSLQAGELATQARNFQAEAVLWTRTWPGFISRQDLDKVKRLGIPTISFHLDLYVGIGRERDMIHDPFWLTDFVFTPDGDPKSQMFFENNNIKHHWLKPGVYKAECKKGNFRQEYAQDVVFVGSLNYHPEWPYRNALHNYLRKTYGAWYRHYGAPGVGVRGQDLNDLYASAKVVVGDSLCLGFEHKNYWSDRIYETTGRGGFMIHPYISGLEQEFVHPKEVVFYRFGEFEQLKGLIDFYVKHNHIREMIRDRGMARTKKEHTYHNRMTELLEVVNANS